MFSRKLAFFSNLVTSLAGSIKPLSSKLTSHLSETVIIVQPFGGIVLTSILEQYASVLKAGT